MTETLSAPAARALQYFEARGTATSSELQQWLGKSQPTVSRLLAEVSTQGVVALRQGRGARYGLCRPLLGSISGEQPIWRRDEYGRTERWGTLRWLAAGTVHAVGPRGAEWLVKDGLPWFLAPLRLEGFLGKLQARSTHLQLRLGDDPRRWSVEEQLYAAVAQVRDAPGALTLGDPEAAPAPGPVPHDDAQRVLVYDQIAADVAVHLSAGSSAAGDQPKFLVCRSPPPDATDAWQWLIVKFTPPRDTPFGARWHDLLHAEALALRTLGEAGEPVTASGVISSGRRSYFEAERFDRLGRRGQRHAVPLWAVHDAFVRGAKQHWVATCEALGTQRRLGAQDVQRVQRWRCFGQLIGNNDMHFGNLSLWADDLAAAKFELAPCYDMLPMAYRPEPMRDDFGLTPLNPQRAPTVDSATWAQAAEWATIYWERVSTHAQCSSEFRSVAALNAERVHALGR